jgi:hypothetical protein
MQNIKPKKMGEGETASYNKNILSDTSLSYSVSGFNDALGENPNWIILQGFEQLLEEHVGRLETAFRRTEAFQLKPFPRYMNQKEVINYLGHEKIFWILVEEYGLKSIRQEHRINIYCSKQVEEKCTMFEHNIAP